MVNLSLNVFSKKYSLHLRSEDVFLWRILIPIETHSCPLSEQFSCKEVDGFNEPPPCLHSRLSDWPFLRWPIRLRSRFYTVTLQPSVMIWLLLAGLAVVRFESKKPKMEGNYWWHLYWHLSHRFYCDEEPWDCKLLDCRVLQHFCFISNMINSALAKSASFVWNYWNSNCIFAWNSHCREPEGTRRREATCCSRTPPPQK